VKGNSSNGKKRKNNFDENRENTKLKCIGIPVSFK
jgi:hypothetical protein